MEKSGLVRVTPYIGVYARSVGVLLGAEVLRALDLRSFLFLAGGGFLALIFLGESFTAKKLAGVILVVSGVALLR
jgi:drug/metabolite transporter (DMT)-like permease